MQTVNANLAATLGGNTGDGEADSVVVNGSNGNDAIEIAGTSATAGVTGLAATVNVTNANAATDALRVNALDGTLIRRNGPRFRRTSSGSRGSSEAGRRVTRRPPRVGRSAGRPRPRLR